MSQQPNDETLIGVSEFKAKCLALLDEMARGKRGRLVITKHGKRLAAVVPLEAELPELWGAMAGTVTIAPGTDLTQPTGETWDANA